MSLEGSTHLESYDYPLGGINFIFSNRKAYQAGYINLIPANGSLTFSSEDTVNNKTESVGAGIDVITLNKTGLALMDAI